MKTALYTAELNTPYGIFIVAMETAEADASADMRTAFAADSKCHIAQVKVGPVSKTTRRVVAGMQAMNHSTNAWAKRKPGQ